MTKSTDAKPAAKGGDSEEPYVEFDPKWLAKRARDYPLLTHQIPGYLPADFEADKAALRSIKVATERAKKRALAMTPKQFVSSLTEPQREALVELLRRFNQVSRP